MSFSLQIEDSPPQAAGSFNPSSRRRNRRFPLFSFLLFAWLCFQGAAHAQVNLPPSRPVSPQGADAQTEDGHHAALVEQSGQMAEKNKEMKSTIEERDSFDKQLRMHDAQKPVPPQRSDFESDALFAEALKEYQETSDERESKRAQLESKLKSAGDRLNRLCSLMETILDSINKLVTAQGGGTLPETDRRNLEKGTDDCSRNLQAMLKIGDTRLTLKANTINQKVEQLRKSLALKGKTRGGSAGQKAKTR